MQFRAGGPSGGVSVGVRLENFVSPSDFPVYHSSGAASSNSDQIMRLIQSSHLVIDNVSQRHFFGSLNSPNDYSEHRNVGLKPEEKEYNLLVDVAKYTSSLGAAISTSFGSSIAGPGVPGLENQVLHTTLQGIASPRMVPLYTWGPTSRKHSWYGLQLSMPIEESGTGPWTVPWYRVSTTGAPPYGYTGPYPAWYGWNNYSGSIPLFSSPFNILRRELEGIQDKDSACSYLGQWNTVAKVDVHRIFSDNPPGATGVGVAEVTTSHNRIKWRQFISSSLLSVRDHDVSFRLVPAANQPTTANAVGRNIFDIEVTWRSTITWYKRPPVRPSPGNPYYDWVLDQSLGTNASNVTSYSRTYRITGTNFLFSKISPPVQVLPGIVSDKSFLEGYHEFYRNNLGFFRPSAMLAYADAIAKHRATSTNYVETIAEIGEVLSMAPELGPLIRAGMEFLQFRDSPGSIYGSLFKNSSQANFMRHGAVTGALKVGDLFSSTFLLKLFGWRPAAQNVQELTSKLDRLSEAIKALQSPQTFHGKFSKTVPFGGVEFELTTRCKVRLRGVSNDFLTAILQLDAVGLAPSSKNVWATIQWSWLIDIFLGMSTRYDVLDAVALGYMVGVDVLVHSFTMRQILPDDVLQKHNIQAADGSELSVKGYAREVSYFVPAIFGGYDYAAPSRPPDKGLVMSLLWQLGRSL